MIMAGRVRKFFSRSLIFLLGCLALLLADYHLAAAAPSKPAKNILLLYSYQSVLPANIEWDGAIRAALKGTAAEPIEFYTEFLDLAQFPDQSYLQSLINLLQNKYARRKIDLLMPMGDLAFHFLLAQREVLFPGVPMVFCGAESNEVQALKRPNATTGVVTWVDVPGTLAAALKLHPQTRQLVLVGGTAETDRSFQRLAREALRPYQDRLEVIFLIDLPIDQILTKVANLPPNTIILYLSLCIQTVCPAAH